MSLEDIRNARIEKLERLKKAKINPYPAKSERDLSQEEFLKSFSKLQRQKKGVRLAGRLLALRGHGGVVFGDLDDGTAKAQMILKRDELGKDAFSLFESTVDIGDFIQVKGRPVLTKKKEKSVDVKEWVMLSKSLRPLPEKWHGLQDVEERFRKRYLDLLINKEVKERTNLRSKIISELRNILEKEGFIEVETPILQPLYGGALAEPFKTHHRMLDLDMYLRIAPELYLKKLLVSGFNKIYEIGRVFRNEGIDTSHNPEFTMLELYETYKNAEYLKNFIAGVLNSLVKKALGKNQIKYNEKAIKFPKKIPSIPFWSIIERHALITRPEYLSRDDFALAARQFGLNPEEGDSKEKIADEIFKKVCRPKLIQPVFITHHPVAISPLAKEFSEKPELVDRFQLIAGGVELVNGFSELNNPLEQKDRFKAHERMRAGKDKEAHPTDESFIEALEYGMPPAAGLGIGIDRLIMLFTDTHNIKEVILFPTMKPKE